MQTKIVVSVENIGGQWYHYWIYAAKLISGLYNDNPITNIKIVVNVVISIILIISIKSENKFLKY